MQGPQNEGRSTDGFRRFLANKREAIALCRKVDGSVNEDDYLTMFDDLTTTDIEECMSPIIDELKKVPKGLSKFGERKKLSEGMLKFYMKQFKQKMQALEDIFSEAIFVFTVDAFIQIATAVKREPRECSAASVGHTALWIKRISLCCTKLRLLLSVSNPCC